MPTAMKTRRWHYAIRDRIFREILKTFKNEVTAIQERGGPRKALRFDDGVKLSVVICRCVKYKFGLRWPVRVSRHEREYPTLVCRCNPDHKSLKDIYLVRRLDRPCSVEFLTREHDPWLRKGKQIRVLSQLRKQLDRILNSALS